MMMTSVEQSGEWVAGEPKNLEITCPSAALSPMWPDLGSNPSRHSGKSEANNLSYGTVFMFEPKRNIVAY
jgi:hypothetical protein